MPTITGHITNVTGTPDNRPWTFTPLGWRGKDPSTVVTALPVTVQPVNGQFSVFLEPGPVLAQAGRHAYTIQIPDTDNIDILTLLSAYVPAAAGSSGLTLADAVNRYLTANPPAGGSGQSFSAVNESIDVTSGEEDNTKFATTYPYVSGSLSVFRNGLREIPRECYCEDDLSEHDFWLSEPALVDDVITAAYATVVAADFGTVQLPSGNLVALDGSRQIRYQSITVDKFHPDALGANGVGPRGPRGATWYTGEGPPPEPYVGAQPDDLYLDTVTGTVYQLGG